MRLKEDPMRNGQTKPAYNLQIMTNSQFVLGHDLLQNPTDTRTLIPFLKHLDQNGVLGKEMVADAGYGSERNYRYWVKSQKGKIHSKIFSTSEWIFLI